MTQDTTSPLAALSAELASVVAKVGPSVVRVDDGSRLTATGVLWSADGVVLTTSHGVERDDELVIELADGNASRRHWSDAIPKPIWLCCASRPAG